ncbi:MAG: hypothetical protein ACREQW_06735 [Candidatus Binatia bacterium]
MDDLPTWLKVVIRLTVGSTLTYTIGAFVYYNILGPHSVMP